MGTYLSTPASEKYKEWGEELECPVQPLRFALVDMQGWRKSMEDAHCVELTVPYPPGMPYLDSGQKEKPPHAKVFGVFDGHGGPEVARFCQLYLVSVLTKQNLWQDGESNNETDEKGISENTGIGQALIESFHALDRMIDDPSRREEIIRLRTHKAPPTERRDAGEIPPIKPVQPIEGGIVRALDLAAKEGGISNILPPPPPPPPAPPANAASGDSGGGVEGAKNDSEEKGNKAILEESAESTAGGVESKDTTTVDETKDEKSALSDETSDVPTPAPPEEVSETPAESDDSQSEETLNEEEREDSKSESGSEKDYDSDEAVGKEEAAERDQNIEDDDEPSDDVQINPYDATVQVVDDNSGEDGATNPALPASKVSVMFQRLLNMNDNQQSGQMVIRVAGEDAENASKNNDPAEQIQAPVVTGPSAAAPSILQNGRLICNLPDHPIHAGCTAVVAVLLGRTLTIANAGDSRGVLCREGGVVEPLSFDHKPQQPREMNRINNAGGFVNRFGRVNGNLNLSRSIGDLKYKQVPGIAPSDQMITAQPDIIQVTLNPKDEFFILGCDGIWDCLTNEKCVEFVRERIDTKEPKDIGEEMLNTILSDDPRATQGIGGDNMTVLIVDLQPASRSYNVDPSWGPEATSAL